MKNLTSAMAAVLILFTLCFSNHFLIKVEGSDLIGTVCRSTPNYELCVSTLRADPRSWATDVTGLALILVDAVKNNSISTVNTINKLKKSKPEYIRQLNACSSKYKAILQADIPEAIKALTKGNPKVAANGMADAAVEAKACEDGFKKGSSNSSPIAKENQAVYDLSVVVSAFIRNLL